MQKWKIPAAVVGILVFVYVFPRLLLSKWSPDNPWLNYFYQYGFGLVVFLVGWWVVLGSGALKRGRGYDGRWFRVMVVGFCVYAVVHAAWIWVAVSIPFRGAN